MRTRIIIFTLSLLLPLLYSCAESMKLSNRNREQIKMSVSAGANRGGITENTDMSAIPGVVVPPEASVDAFTGSTQTGYNAGLHFSKGFGIGDLETGIEIMHNNQTFNYIDAGNFYSGVRRIGLTQVMIPLTYNFNFLEDQNGGAILALKAGLIGQTNFAKVKDSGIRLPDHYITRNSFGFTLGVSAFPVSFKNGSSLGAYIDIYRGSIIYEDLYNPKESEIPGSSFIRTGLIYRFK